jgi:hypothetical protein
MSLSAKDKEALREDLSKMSDEELEIFDRSSRALLRDLEDTTSSYPATQEFLKSRGLTNVRQLDEQGRVGLTQHLFDVLKKLNENAN